MISVSVVPFFRWSIATTCAVLLPSRGPAVSSALAAFLPLGSFLAAAAFLLALAFAGAPLAAGAVPLAFRSSLGFADSPSPWMRSHIRPAAAVLDLNRLTGSTPGKAFQIATR